MPYIDFKQLEAFETADRPGVNWFSAADCHVGNLRELNEDAFYNSAEQGLWAVADGMGGFARGDYASGVVVDALFHFVRSPTLAACIRDLEIRLREAHANCRASFHKEPVGSTVAAMFSYGRYLFLLWAGDSRVYRLRADELSLMTIDHTVAQQKCATGELSPAQAARHPSAHVLTRAVGVHQTLHLELDFDTVEPGDRYLLCSDGLYNSLDESDLRTLLGGSTVTEARDKLIELALKRDGKDNITAIVVEATAL